MQIDIQIEFVSYSLQFYQTYRRKIENKDFMGCSLGSSMEINQFPLQSITVSTLNYSGVLTSPFEFYETQSESQKNLDAVFTSIVKQKYSNFDFQERTQFDWMMGSIDRKWKSRYSPLNKIYVGVKSEENKMMNQKQFLKEWDKIRHQTENGIKKSYFQVKYKPEQIEQKMKIQIEKTRQFDLFCYKTFMKIIYDLDNLQKVDVQSHKYLKERKVWFQKPYLSKILKKNLTLKSIRMLDHDVMYFVETDNIFRSQLKSLDDFIYIPGIEGDSVCIAKKKLFKTQDPIDLSKENSSFFDLFCQRSKENRQGLQMRFNYNKDSAFQAISNYLFINVHLSSNKQKNPIQFSELKKDLNKILYYMPEYKIICGGDFNLQIDILCNDYQKQSLKKFSQLSIYPNNPAIQTVKKKRTMIQPQRHKANKLDESAKDYIITNGQIIKGKCLLINGEDVSNNLPPATQLTASI